MTIIAKNTDILSEKADLLVFGIFNEGKEFSGTVKRIDRLLDDHLSDSAKDEEFFGRTGETLAVHSHGKTVAKRILLVGLGEKKKFDAETCRRTAGLIVKYAKKTNAKKVSVEFFGKIEAVEFASAMTEGVILGDYSFLNYRREEKKREFKKSSIVFSLFFPDATSVKGAEKAISSAAISSAAAIYARDLVNEPANVVTPAHLVWHAQEIAKKNKNIKLRVYDRAACEKMGMGAFLAVAKGSDDPPYFIHLSYTPPKKASKKIVLVGKGLTFDTGGLSLKPTQFMTMEKSDMAGGAAVLAIFSALGSINPDCEIHGLVAACENMISGRSMRVSDIVETMNGKTVEIMNADAEGRMTLADALSYAAKKIKPDTVIDLATLTGACTVALGEQIAGLFSNNQKLADRVLAAAKISGEPLWQMPLVDDYRDSIKNNVTDLVNTGPTRYGEAISAALFLQEFVGETPWVHIDFGGPAFVERGEFNSYTPKGGTGFGVRTLLRFLSK